jgi:hypothetical protein
MSYVDPGLDRETLIEAHRRHDAEKHIVCMWPRARYKGEFGYPPEPKPVRSRLRRFIDSHGRVQQEVK